MFHNMYSRKSIGDGSDSEKKDDSASNDNDKEVR